MVRVPERIETNVSHVALEDVTVSYVRGSRRKLGRHDYRVEALRTISIAVHKGELLVLLGPSGCGKSTLLNTVAGLVAPTSGKVRVGDRTVFQADSRVNLPPEKRGLGMVFQSYSLWPHMTAYENVEFPLRFQSVGTKERRRLVEEALDLVRCGDLSNRTPGTLSGGQQQRIALARAIVASPTVMLFDEPLSNLDALLREELRDEIASLHAKLGFTGIYVTHDQVEALSLGTRIAVMREGTIEQIDRPEDLYRNPHSEYVARFLGAQTLAARVEKGSVSTEFGVLATDVDAADGPYVAAFQPDAVQLSTSAGGTAAEASSSTAGDLAFVVESVQFTGQQIHYGLMGPRARLKAVAPAGAKRLEAGTKVDVRVARERLSLFPAQGDQRVAPDDSPLTR